MLDLLSVWNQLSLGVAVEKLTFKPDYHHARSHWLRRLTTVLADLVLLTIVSIADANIKALHDDGTFCLSQ